MNVKRLAAVLMLLSVRSVAQQGNHYEAHPADGRTESTVTAAPVSVDSPASGQGPRFIRVIRPGTTQASANQEVPAPGAGGGQNPGAKSKTPGQTSSAAKESPESAYEKSIEEQAKKACPTNPRFSICQPKDKRVQYLKDQFAKAKKPMSNEFVNSFGPGFPASELAFARWTLVIVGPWVVSCDEAVSKYGLFGGDKTHLGDWAKNSNRDFYDDNKFIGSGGAAIHTTQWIDKATGSPMVEPSLSFDAIGYCNHNK
jgi:hypothetical protein